MPTSRPIDPPSASGRGLQARAIGALGGVWLRMAERRRRHRRATQFQNLGDAMLRDIGLNRSMVNSANFASDHPRRIKHHI